jgi:ribosomal protein S27AE
MGKAKYEYQRTCSRCGDVRFLPAELVEAKPRKQALMVGWATPLVGKKRQALRAEKAVVDLQNVQLAEAQRCPACGSGAHTDERVALEA